MFVHSVFAQPSLGRTFSQWWLYIIKLILYESQEVRKEPFPANLTLSGWTDRCLFKCYEQCLASRAAQHNTQESECKHTKMREEQLNISSTGSERRLAAGWRESPASRISSCSAEHPSAGLGGCVWDGKGGGWTNPFPCHWAAW